jgi:signal transduction histidine kinase
MTRSLLRRVSSARPNRLTSAEPLVLLQRRRKARNLADACFLRLPRVVGVTLPVAPSGLTTLEDYQRFPAFVAHELRTPITLQRALVELALADPHANTTVLRAMGKDVLASCEQQQRLIDALLDLTSNQHGRARHEPVDIAAITSEALGAHDLTEFKSVVTLEPAWTTGDPDLLVRLATNLLSNATRHNLAGGLIAIATRTEAEHAVLSIANTGSFIPAAELTRLFHPFERLDSQPRACADSVGLGLAIVRAIADAHDATITAHARANGGLRIDVGFPANAADGSAPAPSRKT